LRAAARRSGAHSDRRARRRRHLIKPRPMSARERLHRLLAPLTGGSLRQMVRRALALHPRGVVQNDVLTLRDVSPRPRVAWHARALHPWDEHLPERRRVERFREQMLHDTDAAIVRLFELTPDIDTVEVSVLAPEPPNRVLLAGRVLRADVLSSRSLTSLRR